MTRDHKIRILASGLSGQARERRILWLLLHTDQLNTLLAGKMHRSNHPRKWHAYKANKAYKNRRSV